MTTEELFLRQDFSFIPKDKDELRVDLSMSDLELILFTYAKFLAKKNCNYCEKELTDESGITLCRDCAEGDK